MDASPLPALYYLTALYCAVALYAIIGGWRKRSQHGQPRLIWFLTLPVVACVALFYGGNYAWAMLFLLATEEPASTAAFSTAVVFALLAPAMIVGRLASGRAALGYRLWILGGCVGLLLLNRLIDGDFFSPGNVDYLAIDSVVGLYIVVATYAMLVGWQEEERAQVRLRWFLIAPITVFVAYWFAGKLVWARIWMIRGIASPVQFPIGKYANWSSAIGALLLSSVVFVRLAIGAANRRYLQMAFFGPVLLLTASGATVAYPVIRTIDGWTDVGAAEKTLARIQSQTNPNVPLRLVREIPTPSQSPSYGSFPIRKEYSSFVIYRGNEPITHIVVQPCARFWWTHQYTGPIKDESE
jgi:hypothetical protein